VVIVGTDQHAFVGPGFDCEGVLGERGGPVCGQGRTAHIHRDLAVAASTQLRETQAAYQHAQQALAASQAALTAMRAERDEALGRVTDLLEDVAWQKQVIGMLRENEETRAQVIRERNCERDLLRAELASARTELEQLRDEAAVTEARRAELQAIAERQLTEIKQLRRDPNQGRDINPNQWRA
jgi:mannose/cellobiose epimerase-like protein (N-acyl-D-glucosamine 2-epimerase family)